jgi:hypothetical protein
MGSPWVAGPHANGDVALDEMGEMLKVPVAETDQRTNRDLKATLQKRVTPQPGSPS